KKLNIGKPEVVAKATDYIAEMIEYVTALTDKGYAYETDDGIYFDIAKFPDYGKLSRLKLDAQQAGARVGVNTQKRNPADFALWKKAEKNHIMQWKSPWGMGYPGWHIECSAMGRKFFGKVLDIHTGGVDHIPVHHENEIAQSEAREGGKTVNYWMHGAFMLVDGGKMSKSLGNAYTVTDLEKRGYRPLAFRYFCLNAHYKKELNFTFEGMDAAQVALGRLYLKICEHKAGAPKTDANKLQGYRDEFAAAVLDDLNIPMALGVLWTMLKESPSSEIYKLALEFDAVFGLDLHLAVPPKKEDTDAVDLPAEMVKLLDARLKARQNKNWGESDRLRDLIKENGYTVKDTADGYTITKL
ncbi:MAG: cysteine--tRNA ligase, partial [Firmicutes bacterium]|nr:cysteine--tRNA ligase [Bacillota bacterium]